MSPITTISTKTLASSLKINSSHSLMDEYDGRSRNAKAQKRHREKQKARVKALEDSVQVLTAQLEDARRQLGQLPYAPGSSRLPLGPHSPEFSQLQAEGQYLREENSNLRRQIYSIRLTYGGPPDASTTADLGASPPLRQGSSQGQHPPPRQNSNQQSNPQSTSTVDGTTSASATSSSFQSSNVDHYARAPGAGSRTRVQSSSSVRPLSAPSAASPYLPSSASFGDLRSHSLSHNNNNNNTNSSNSTSAAQTATSAPSGMTPIDGRYPMRYDSYPYSHNPPPPHSLPRSQNMYGGVDGLPGYRGEGGESLWASDTGPHYPGNMNYPGVNFHGSPSIQTPESWRQGH